MPQVTNTDIRELKDLIQGLDRKMETGFSNTDSKMELGFSDLKGEIKTVNSRLSNLELSAAKLPDLAEKVGELKNWKQIAIILFTGIVTGTIGWFLRGGSNN